MVDAAVGGKTGINFNDFKNEIGVFRNAKEVIIDTSFLSSLDSQNLRSGYAEMLKHSLLKDTAMWASHVTFDLCKPNFVQLQEMVRQSIEVKRAVVAEDPTEKGIQKALNFEPHAVMRSNRWRCCNNARDFTATLWLGVSSANSI